MILGSKSLAFSLICLETSNIIPSGICCHFRLWCHLLFAHLSDEGNCLSDDQIWSNNQYNGIDFESLFLSLVGSSCENIRRPVVHADLHAVGLLWIGRYRCPYIYFLSSLYSYFHWSVFDKKKLSECFQWPEALFSRGFALVTRYSARRVICWYKFKTSYWRCPRE